MSESGEKLETLFYELDMRTEGFERGIHESHEALTNFTEFVATKPALALGALAAAFIAAGEVGVEMAEEIENSMHRIEALLPNGAPGVRKLREEIEEMSKDDLIPHAQAELAALAEQIAKMGVADPGEIATRLRASVITADAASVDVKVVVEELDQVLDLFRISGEKSEEVLAKLFNTARGKVGLDELLESFRMAAPAVQRFHLTLDDTARAFATLRDQGYRARQAAGELQRLAALGEDGAARMKELVEGTAAASSNFADVEEASRKANDNLGAMWQHIKNQLAPVLIELGEKILPVVVRELKGLAGLIALFDGTIDTIKMDAFATTLQVIGDNIDTDKVDASSAAYKRFVEALGNVREGFIQGVFEPSKLSKDALEKTLVAIDKYVTVSEKLRPQAIGTAFDVRNQIAPLREALQRALADAVSHETANVESGTTTGGTGRGRTAAQIAEDIARAKERNAALASLQNAVAQGAGDPTAAFEARVTALRKSVADAVKHGVLGVKEVEDAIQRMRQNFAKTQADAFNQLKKDIDVALAGFTGGQADSFEAASQKHVQALQLELDKHKELSEVERKAQQDRIDAYAAQAAAQTAVLRQTDEAQKLIQRAADPQVMQKGWASLLQEIEQRQQSMRESQKGMKEDSLEYKTLSESINALEQSRKSILDSVSELNDKEIADLQRAAELRRIQVEHLSRIAGYIGEGIRAAVQLAEAFGIVNSETSRVLDNIASIAESLPKALAGDISSIINVAAKTIDSIGVIFGGDSAEQKQHRSEVLENTQALKALTDKVGLLGNSNLSGSTLGTAADVAQRLVNTDFMNSIHSVGFQGRLVRKEWDQLTSEQRDAFNEAAKEFGITIDGSAEHFMQAVQAILEASGKLGEFGDDFTSFTKQAEAARKIFGDDTAAKRLTDLAEAAQKGVPALSKLFEGLDLTKQTDLDKLRQRVQELFKVMEAGGEKLAAGDLGSLTGDQLLNEIIKIITELDNLSPATQTLSDKLAKLQNDFAVFDIDDPIEQFKQLFQLFAKESPALAKLADGLDLGTTEGLEAFEQRLRELYTTLGGPGAEGIDAGSLSVKELIDAIVQLSGGADVAAQSLKDAADTLVGIGEQMRELRRGFDILGIDDPVQQLNEVIALYSKVSPRLKQLFETFDLSTQEGRAAAEAAIKEFYRQNIGKTNIDQGGLTDEEVKAALEEIVKGIRDVPTTDTSVNPNTTRQESGAERITIQQADRLLSLTETIMLLMRKVVENTLPLKDLLSPINFFPVSAPSLAGATGSGSVMLRVEVTNINTFGNNVSPGQASDFGSQLGSSLGESLNLFLGGRLQNLRAAAGDPTVNLS